MVGLPSTDYLETDNQCKGAIWARYLQSFASHPLPFQTGFRNVKRAKPVTQRANLRLCVFVRARRATAYKSDSFNSQLGVRGAVPLDFARGRQIRPPQPLLSRQTSSGMRPRDFGTPNLGAHTYGSRPSEYSKDGFLPSKCRIGAEEGFLLTMAGLVMSVGGRGDAEVLRLKWIGCSWRFALKNVSVSGGRHSSR